MTITEASKHIGVSPSTLYQLVAARKIAHFRVGGKIILHEDDIDAFMAGCHVAVSSIQSTIQTPRLKLKHINLSRGG